MEFFIQAMSFAAPFVSDESSGFVEAESPQKALEKFAAEYTHPAGLYSANCYASADAYHKGEERLAQWLCNHEQAKQKATEGKGGYSYRGNGAGKFEIDGKEIEVENPKAGSVA